MDTKKMKKVGFYLFALIAENETSLNLRHLLSFICSKHALPI